METTHLNPEYKEVEKVNVSLRKAWNLLLNEVLEGKKIFLKITDEFGTPLEAKVEIERIKYFQEEIRVSNPINGFFFQLFPDRKETKVKISKEGYEPTEIQTRPNGKWEPLKIVLKKIEYNVSHKTRNLSYPLHLDMGRNLYNDYFRSQRHFAFYISGTSFWNRKYDLFTVRLERI
ncbi:hypothetical protein LEP1GSC150_2934 [Leptospira interrogans serovar Copenhageni str. LT2050]|uniref:Carboxypeptidase regulatory-like domain-containing protein n=1 Tax=Leptospira interrogans serovar Copenhageni str. LT2050 TaxID=1001598 RepID=M3G3C1_LEPIT|nr:hypothetical protein LEP1GSC150_2934 [Leptospira interrogans serovar Copenhageni str. LT2050]